MRRLQLWLPRIFSPICKRLRRQGGRAATWAAMHLPSTSNRTVPTQAQNSHHALCQNTRVQARASYDVATTHGRKGFHTIQRRECVSKQYPTVGMFFGKQASRTSSQGPLLPKAHDSRGLRGWVGPAIIKSGRRKIKSDRTKDWAKSIKIFTPQTCTVKHTAATALNMPCQPNLPTSTIMLAASTLWHSERLFCKSAKYQVSPMTNWLQAWAKIRSVCVPLW